ncbi:MAG TPA: carboxypeptidase regulatory-like domain-containing protein, partial [Planctomycetota bacterium]|nr:carboxypeptidase regulatory-like domain-containing protein [Planctomycetota bacterium]
GRPVPGALVSAVQVDLEWRDTPVELRILDLALRYGQESCVRTDGEGRFVLGGLAGSSVSLGAVAEGFEPTVAHDVAPGRRDVVLALREPAELYVSVRDRATGAALAATLEAAPASGPQQPADSWREALPVSAVPGRMGEYLVRGAGSQATRVEAIAPDHARAVAWAEGQAPGTRGELTIDMEPGHALAGRVIDESGAPVADAGLTLERSAERGPRRDPQCTRSGADGGFRFADLPANTYDLTVQADGFALATLPALQLGDADPAPMEVRLQHAGDIEGMLLDAAGQPARGFQVEADFPGLSSLYSHADTSGRFALRDLLPGTWKLSSFSTGEVPVQVRAGETAQVELRLAPPSYILGRVTCGGQPVEGAHLRLHAEGMPWVSTDTPADGRFKLQVAAMTWTVNVSTDLGGSASSTVDVLTGESRHVDFVLPSGALVVHATGPHGEPARRALLRLERPADPPPAANAEPNSAWEGVAQRFAEDDGVARFAQIAPGPYRVRVGVGGDWVDGQPVEAQMGDGSVDVTMVLHPAATLAGRVQAAGGVPLAKGTSVYLYAADGERQLLRMARLDETGTFIFDALAPGGYVAGVYAIPPDHLGDVPALAEQSVTLQEGQQADVTLVLPPHG